MNRKLYKMCLILSVSLCVMCTFTACKSKSYFQSVSENESASGEWEDNSEETSQEGDANQEAEKQQATGKLCVQVSGAVKKPGIYELPMGSRVYEVIEMAGGLTEDADESSLNQAAKLTDEQKIVVLTHAEAEAQMQQATEEQSSLVDLNTATQEELMTLTGVGESKAKAIIVYRKEHGNFTKIEDIMNISGIKEGAFNKIKNDITVN